ncbi:hypothetical protein [Thiofilum flexile]|uniref:hypothetical protein n=1 Tax=Thiofilum flexile TaxID=125627 RepID=UPI0003717C0B|nr:hypothetical protein [Thiofilum flexile]
MYVVRRVALVLLSCLLIACNDPQESVTEVKTTDSNRTASINTSAGTLKIAVGENTVPDSLFLNGDLIFQREREQLRFYGQQKRAQDEVVLMGSSCGVSCATDQLFWVVLKEGTQPEIIEDRQFYANPLDISILPAEPDKLTVNLGFSQKQRRYADLEGNVLSFRLEPVTESDKILAGDLCTWLHTEALPACISARATEPDCVNPQTEFPDYMDQRLGMLNEYPGFNGDAFGALCANACEKEDIPDYKTFASTVCGIR